MMNLLKPDERRILLRDAFKSESGVVNKIHINGKVIKYVRCESVNTKTNYKFNIYKFLCLPFSFIVSIFKKVSNEYN